MNLGNIVGILAVGVVMFLMVKKIFKNGSCCGSHSSHGGKKTVMHCSHDESDSQKQIPPTEETVLDPICGMLIGKESAITRERDGKTYYFCSESCVKKFDSRSRIA